MRLHELLTEAPPVLKRSKGSQTQRPALPTIGQGAFARVLGHKDNPHEVMKLSHQSQHPRSRDGYEAFVKALAESDMHENPYFPRIQTMRTITDEYGKVAYQVRMERLTSLKDITEEQAESIVRKALTPAFIKASIIEQRGWSGGWLWERILLEWTMKASNHSKRLPADFIRTAADNDLKEALMFISELADGNYLLDLQTFNFMVRQSPYGAQLVITDPLGSQRYS